MSPDGLTSEVFGAATVVVVAAAWLVGVGGVADFGLPPHAPARIPTAIAPEVRTILRLISAFHCRPESMSPNLGPRG
jgi:hypothetical protein